MSALASLGEPADLAELAPALRRAVALDPHGLARLRSDHGRVTVVLRLPFEVLVARTVLVAAVVGPHDVTVRAAELLAWIDGARTDAPARHDAEWRSAVPPSSGWRRIDTVPEDVVRGLVERGARLLDDVNDASRPDPRASASRADVLLDSVVLTVTADDGSATAELTLRALSALTRMGFLPRGSHVAVDLCGRWVRVAAEYGSVYTERPGSTLSLL